MDYSTMTNEQYLKHIENARRHIDRDPDLVFFIVRDWEITKTAGLRDYAWTASKEGNTAPNEAKDILDQLENIVRAMTNEERENEQTKFDSIRNILPKKVQSSYRR